MASIQEAWISALDPLPGDFPPLPSVSNEFASLLDKETSSNSITLSELLGIDRALVPKLQASLAAALHYVRASAIFFYVFGSARAIAVENICGRRKYLY